MACFVACYQAAFRSRWVNFGSMFVEGMLNSIDMQRSNEVSYDIYRYDSYSYKLLLRYIKLYPDIVQVYQRKIYMFSSHQNVLDYSYPKTPITESGTSWNECEVCNWMSALL